MTLFFSPETLPKSFPPPYPHKFMSFLSFSNEQTTKVKIKTNKLKRQKYAKIKQNQIKSLKEKRRKQKKKGDRGLLYQLTTPGYRACPGMWLVYTQ